MSSCPCPVLHPFINTLHPCLHAPALSFTPLLTHYIHVFFPLLCLSPLYYHSTSMSSCPCPVLPPFINTLLPCLHAPALSFTPLLLLYSHVFMPLLCPSPLY